MTSSPSTRPAIAMAFHSSASANGGKEAMLRITAERTRLIDEALRRFVGCKGLVRLDGGFKVATVAGDGPLQVAMTGVLVAAGDYLAELSPRFAAQLRAGDGEARARLAIAIGVTFPEGLPNLEHLPCLD